MVGHGGSSAASYLADPTFPIPSHCASIVMTSTLRVNKENFYLTLYKNVHVCSYEIDVNLMLKEWEINSIIHDERVCCKHNNHLSS